MSSATPTTTWDPTSFLSSGSAASKGKSRSVEGSEAYAVILLNQSIPSEQVALFRDIWEGATVRICADGGGNRLLGLLASLKTDSSLAGSISLPDAIVGDLDSLSEESRTYYTARNVAICHKPSQYATDLQKSIQWIEDWEDQQGDKDGRIRSPPLTLVIVGGLSGRMDQTAHTLHVLWKLSPPLSSIGGYEDPEESEGGRDGRRGGTVRKRHRTWVVGDGCMVMLLPPGKHTLIHISPPLGIPCGVLPFGVKGGSEGTSAARVRTEGLEWDLDPSQPQSLGGYLSTSNHVVYPPAPDEGPRIANITVETDQPIYWSVALGSH